MLRQFTGPLENLKVAVDPHRKVRDGKHRVVAKIIRDNTWGSYPLNILKIYPCFEWSQTLMPIRFEYQGFEPDTYLDTVAVYLDPKWHNVLYTFRFKAEKCRGHNTTYWFCQYQVQHPDWVSLWERDFNFWDGQLGEKKGALFWDGQFEVRVGLSLGTTRTYRGVNRITALGDMV